MRERWMAKPRDARNEGGSPRRKKRLPAQPEPMKYALASQRKNTIGWCVKHWKQTVNNQNHWQVDDGWSTAGMFVTFPENWHSIKSSSSSHNIIYVLQFCQLILEKAWFLKLFCAVRLALKQNMCILVVAVLNSIVEDQINVKCGFCEEELSKKTVGRLLAVCRPTDSRQVFPKT